MEPKEALHALKLMIDQNRVSQIARTILNYPRIKELVYCLDLEGKNVAFRAMCIKEDEECLRVLEYLLSKGCDLKQKDSNKQTIIYFAAKDEKQKTAHFLAKHFNYSLNDDDFFNQTPLFYSAKFNRGARVSQYLLESGCDVNHKDNNGQTCLFYSAGTGNMELCKLYIEYGANAQLIDKNRQKASNYARRNGHQRIVDYLQNCKVEVRRVKEERVKEERVKDERDRRMQESSQNTVQPRKKKQVFKNQYSLIYTNENGESKVLTFAEVQRFRKACEQNEKLCKMMVQPDQPMEGLGPLIDKKFQRTALKILNYFIRQQNSYPFHEPVNYVGLGLLDYPSIVRFPMDFGTIKKKLSFNAYENQLEFQEDMNLVFDNCILYNGKEKDLGKMALQMKIQFNTMYAKEFSS